ncbi:MAG: TIGR00730 family Rossman fold protein [Clostridia bacterium]|nr:TIGR00730 family Rossman fold protein [Clostridia bacterium]
MRLCVYGAASTTIDQTYIDAVEFLGAELVRRGHSLVFGGGGNGLMGAVARGVHAEGGEIMGVIPKFFQEEGVEALCDFADHLVYPETMRERKQIMEDNADGFIVTPGGIGTFEEFFEILTLKQLCRHEKPIAIYNVNGYYDELILFMRKASDQQFIRETCMDLFFITDDMEEMFRYLENPAEPKHSVKELKDG